MWVLVSTIANKDVSSEKDSLETFGSWTTFMKSVSSVKSHKAILEFLEVASLTPTDNMCKHYMDNLSKEVGQLDLHCLFLRTNEAVYSKLTIIKWLNGGLFDKKFPLLGGFHTLLVKSKTLHKSYVLLGMKDWLMDSHVVAVNSANKAAERKHSCRATWLCEQYFEALACFRIMKNLEILTH